MGPLYKPTGWERHSLKYSVMPLMLRGCLEVRYSVRTVLIKFVPCSIAFS